ncbi:hypothetical protein NOI24_06185 [Neorhizobium galegae]|uniref:hypothetical protein n=1 Tax=Neorhizobium galegae TaxID=399 RepID=UPI002104C04F|nr:hypothetical protein [Neorhizobium galegae]MCQ1770877.1 hypothetical protein [Neorhizobium galegae]MCQ1799597.1 hypothetical protein [Neorhizobium galegae]
MWKWTKRLFFIALILGAGYVAYDGYRAGLFNRPEMPEGAFSISFKQGLRAILVDVPNEKKTRRYFGYSMKVPFYLEDAWSFCSPPVAEENNQVAAFMKEREWPGERFEGVCKIKVDNDLVVRGLITSVPRL